MTELLPNALIAGANKAGTTSIFRYLGDHPEVSATTIKEAQVLSQPGNNNISAIVMAYAGLFEPAAATSRIRLEASPQFLQKGLPMAKRLAEFLPDARLIFCLREPVSRMISVVKSLSARNDPALSGIDLDNFATHCIEAIHHRSRHPASETLQFEISRGYYLDPLRAYREMFPAEQIHVCFFDELQASPCDLMRKLAGVLDIDPGFYDDYEFSVQNKTRAYRSRHIHKFAHRANMAFESFWSRHPGVKGMLQKVYLSFNEGAEKTVEASPEAESIDRLRQHFTARNAGLARFLEQELGIADVPAWART